MMKDVEKANLEKEDSDEEEDDEESKSSKHDKDTAEEDKDRLQKDELKKQVAKYSKELDTYRQQIDALQRESRRAKRERDLVRLEQNEGVIFDMEEELGECEDYPEDKYEKYKTRMVARYAKAPVGVNGKIPVYNQASDLPKGEVTQTLIDKATALYQEGKIPYAEALKQVGIN